MLKPPALVQAMKPFDESSLKYLATVSLSDMFNAWQASRMPRTIEPLFRPLYRLISSARSARGPGFIER